MVVGMMAHKSRFVIAEHSFSGFLGSMAIKISIQIDFEKDFSIKEDWFLNEKKPKSL
jgi:hypothetical protein